MTEKKRCVLVTGASGGIGQAIAQSFYARGDRVILHGTRRARLEKLRDNLGERASIACYDLSKEGAAVDMVNDIGKEVGDIDILINNAGLTRDTLLMRMKDEDWDHILNVNLSAIMRLCRAVILPMMKNRWGRIVNISSVVARMGNVGQCNYAASKAGLEGFSRSLALEVVSRNVTVNCLAPGFIETPMTAELSANQRKFYQERIPMKRMGTPEDIAEVALFLSTASYMTGTTVPVNGGLLLY